jgi:dihydrofolate reductase
MTSPEERMGKLIYLTLMSLDGYIEDESGKFDWAEPDEEVHQFVNDLVRSAGTFLYGRRMYETMTAWETVPTSGAPSPAIGDFATIWQAADKIVYSTTLPRPSTEKTRVERTFDPDGVRALKATVAQDVGIGGADLAARAFEAGLIDECQLFLAPVAVGRGKRALPDHLRLDLELLDERRFASGFVYVGYRVVA